LHVYIPKIEVTKRKNAVPPIKRCQK